MKRLKTYFVWAILISPFPPNLIRASTIEWQFGKASLRSTIPPLFFWSPIRVILSLSSLNWTKRIFTSLWTVRFSWDLLQVKKCLFLITSLITIYKLPFLVLIQFFSYCKPQRRRRCVCFPLYLILWIIDGVYFA